MPSRIRLALIIGVLAYVPQLRAEVRFATPVVKLGEVRGGPALTQRFVLTNSGSAPIQLGDVVRGCSCLQSSIDKVTLAPGEVGTLTLTLRTLGHKNGPYAWNAKIRYRETDQVKEAHCRLEGVIRNEVTLDPSELVLFVTDELTQNIHLTDLRDTPLRITRIETTLPGVSLDKTETKPGSFRIQLHVKGEGIPYGPRDGRVDIHTNDPAYSMVTLPVRLIRSYPKAVQAVPNRIRFNPEQGIKSVLIRLRTPDEKPLKITRVEGGDLKASWADHPAGGIVLRLTATESVPPAIRIVFETPGRDLELPVDVD